MENIEIPSLLLQPYVENAIIHGLYNKDGQGKLAISFSRQNDLLKCVVEDDGVGRKEALRIKKRNAIQHKSLGMIVTKERLDIINKTNDVSVKIYDLQNKAAQPRGTRVEIFVHI
jgi:sensor histidine kinase YesM